MMVECCDIRISNVINTSLHYLSIHVCTTNDLYYSEFSIASLSAKPFIHHKFPVSI